MALSSVFDWCMLLLCTYLVSSSVNKEMVEIRAAYVILRSRLEAPKADARGSGKYLGDSTRVHNPKKEAGVHWLWRVLLFEIGLLRQCCVLPLVIATVPMFCLGMGMDALNVALNSLAVLFILEVDNSMFPMVLTASQQEYLATIEVAQVSVAWHPHSKRNTAMDVGATFVAVFAPLLLNHLVMRGGNFFMPPLMEICFGSMGFWTALTLLCTLAGIVTDTRCRGKDRLGQAVLCVLLVLAHYWVTFGIVSWALTKARATL